MGQRYFLSKKDYKNKIGIKNTLILKDVLTPKEAKELIEIQTVIANEISEPITILTEEGLTKKSPYRFKETIFCLAVKDSKCIGYGYGYIEDENKNTFYLDTIGVSREHRGEKIGTEIKVKLINHAFEKTNIIRIKAITQADNKKTIHINMKLGFKRDKEETIWARLFGILKNLFS